MFRTLRATWGRFYCLEKGSEEQYVQIWCARLERFARPCADQDDAWDRANGQMHENLRTLFLENSEATGRMVSGSAKELPQWAAVFRNSLTKSHRWGLGLEYIAVLKCQPTLRLWNSRPQILSHGLCAALFLLDSDPLASEYYEVVTLESTIRQSRTIHGVGARAQLLIRGRLVALRQK